MDLSPTQAVVSSPTFIDSPLSSLSRDRRGLLPLKKRRLHLGHGNQTTVATGGIVGRSAELDFQQASASNSNDDRMEALALVGASSAPFGASSSSSFAHIVSSSSTTLDTCVTATSDASVLSSASSLPKSEAGVAAADKRSSSTVPTSRAPNQQDRRFTANDPPHARCQATTTRGRPCAFVSVVGRQYCHLHATYGTNPPPRRCGYTDGTVVAASPGSRSHGVGKGSHNSKNETPKKSKSRKANPTSHTDSIGDGPGPLLSSTPSSQWSSKLVQVATGPFEGEDGTVLKWGNGWVTVRLLKSGKVGGDSTPNRRRSKEKYQGVLHNRRAVELYLLPTEGKEGKEEEDRPNA